MKDILIILCFFSVTVAVISELYILYWIVKGTGEFFSSKRGVIAMSIVVIGLLIYVVTACIIFALGWGEEKIYISLL